MYRPLGSMLLYAHLRRALQMAEEWKLIRKAPKIKLLPGERQREFVIKEALLTKMLAHDDCTDLLQVLLPFLIDTGLRISEAVALNVDAHWPGAEAGRVHWLGLCGEGENEIREAIRAFDRTGTRHFGED